MSFNIPHIIAVNSEDQEHGNSNGDHQLRGIPGEIELEDDENIAAWQKLQYGMFIHWGLYSELGGVWEGEPVTSGYSEQIQMWADISDEDYYEVAQQFTAENFNPKKVCNLAKDAGMRYIVITSKHHDGFAMFDTDTTEYDIVDSTPYGEDPLKKLADECRDQGLEFGVYFSLVDWNQGHEFDYNNNNPIPEEMEPFIERQLRELMTNYGPISEVWFDMSSPTAEQSKKFSNIVRELQPQAAINSRIFNNEHDFRTLGDNQVPPVTLDGAWQTPASIYNETWGYRSWQVRDDFSGKVRELVEGLASVTARGGNYLLNIGPRGDGSIVDFEAEVLREIGRWLDRHPGAILEASATKFGGQSWGEVTVNDNNLFLHVTDWPEDGVITLPGLETDVLQVFESGTTNELDWYFEGNDLVVILPDSPGDEVLPVIHVSLTEELRIIPENTITADEKGSWNISQDDLVKGQSYADSGSYYSTEQTIVRKTAYLAGDSDKSVFIDIEGEADPNKHYQVQLGTQSKVVSGQKLINSEVGPFAIPADKVVSLNVTLADPEHKSEDLNLQFDSANVFSITNAEGIKGFVSYFEEYGAFANEAAVRSLQTHLTAVSNFEKQEEAEKVVKHMEQGFKDLLNYQKDNEYISEEAFNSLQTQADALVAKWQ